MVARESEGIGTTLSEEPGGSVDALYGPRRSSRSKQIVSCAVAIAMMVVGCLVIGIAMIQGSWWYPMMTDRELSREQRAQLHAVRDEIAESGTAPQSLVWFDVALSANTDPTHVLEALVEAHSVLKDCGEVDDRWLQVIWQSVEMIRPQTGLIEGSPYPVSTVPLDL